MSLNWKIKCQKQKKNKKNKYSIISWLFGKDTDAGKGWGQEEKGVTEDEKVGWYHWLNGHEFEQAPGDGEGQRSPQVCCSPWGCRESGMTYQLDNNIIFSINIYYSIFLSISIHYSTTGGVVFVHLLNFLSTIEKEYYTLMNWFISSLR